MSGRPQPELAPFIPPTGGVPQWREFDGPGDLPREDQPTMSVFRNDKMGIFWGIGRYAGPHGEEGFHRVVIKEPNGGGGVGALFLVDDDGEVYVAKQQRYRATANGHVPEIPRGYAMPKESSATAGERETTEELGLKRPLASFTAELPSIGRPLNPNSANYIADPRSRNEQTPNGEGVTVRFFEVSLDDVQPGHQSKDPRHRTYVFKPSVSAEVLETTKHEDKEEPITQGMRFVHIDLLSRTSDGITNMAFNRLRVALESAGRPLDHGATLREQALTEEIANLRAELARQQIVGTNSDHAIVEMGLATEAQVDVKKKPQGSDLVTRFFGMLNYLQRMHGIVLPNKVLHPLALAGRRFKSHSVKLPDGSYMDYMPVKGAGVLEVHVHEGVSSEALDSAEASVLLQRTIQSQLGEKINEHDSRIPFVLNIHSITNNADGSININYELISRSRVSDFNAHKAQNQGQIHNIALSIPSPQP